PAQAQAEARPQAEGGDGAEGEGDAGEAGDESRSEAEGDRPQAESRGEAQARGKGAHEAGNPHRRAREDDRDRGVVRARRDPGAEAPLSADELRAALGSEADQAQPGDGEAPATPARPLPTGPAMGTGRRKEAVVRVRLVPGTGQFALNGRSLDEYFPTRAHRM